MKDYKELIGRLHMRISLTTAGSPLQDDLLEAADAIKELLPSAQLNDLISRQAAIDALAKHEKSKGHNYTLFVDIVSECAEIIRDLPTVKSERIGRWVPFDLTWGRSVYACTACGDAFEVPTVCGKPIYAYCPYCGARMEASE